MDSSHFVIYIALLCTQVHLVKSCDEEWERVDEVCYYFSKDVTLSRDAAQARCEEMGGQLASVTTKYINDYLRYEMFQQSTEEGTKHHWIGFVGSENSQNKHEWRWLNGQIIADMPWYSDELWHDYEPSAETSVCGLIGHPDKTFGNSWCTDIFRYICETSADTGQEEWELFNGHWYFFSNQAQNFMQAMHVCFSLNAYLGAIDSVEELSFVRNRTDPPQNYWIGLTTLHWLDGSPITWSNFNELNVPQGKNPHVYLHTSENKWESTNNDNLQLRFICQKELRTTSTSTRTTTTMTSTSTTTGVITTSTSGDMVEVPDKNATENPNTEIVKRGNHDILMIIAIVISVTVVSAAVVITTVCLIRRKRFQKKMDEHLYYNTGDSSLHKDNTRNQDIVYYNAEEINTQNTSHNTGYQDASYENPDNVPSTGQDAAYQEVEFERQILTNRNANVENNNSSYQELSFDDNARHDTQNVATYQELNSVAMHNE